MLGDHLQTTRYAYTNLLKQTWVSFTKAITRNQHLLTVLRFE